MPSWPYVHITLNHFPIILMVVGTAVLFLALFVKHRAVWLYALATLTLAGLSIYPAFYSGDEASHALSDKWYIDRALVHEHDDAAGYALVVVLAVGVAAGYAWWRMLRRERTGIPPGWLQVLVALIAAFALSVVVRTAYLGGKIMHDSPKLEQGQPGKA